MSRPRTTICCSALALTAVFGAHGSSQTPPIQLPFFPVQAVWTLALNTVLVAPPAFDGSHAYFALADDRLAAYDLVAGQQVWLVPARIQSKPAAGDGLVFIVEPDALAALRATDGGTAWRLPFTERLAVPLAWDNGWLIAATGSGALLAFRATDGELIWRRDLASSVGAPPALAADRVYAPARDGRLIALSIDTGAEVWERRLGGALNELLALDDRLYVGSDDNFLYCVKTSNGEVDWRWRTGGDVVGRPVTDEQRVYFASLDNVLRALDRKSGAQRWKQALPFRPLAGPTIAGATVIVNGTAPPVRGYLATNGAASGEVVVAGELVAPTYFAASLGPPLLIVVSRDIAKGDTVTAVTRAIEPPILPIAPLPDPVPVIVPTTSP